MDSINRQQPEQNRQDLQAADAVARIREVVDKNASCFFCTASHLGDAIAARPMSVQQADERGHLWFLSASDSHKNAEIAADPAVTLYFQASKHSDFLHLRGRASLSTDKAKIKALWSAPLKTWFTGGIDDPRITVIEFAPTDGYYWDNQHGDAVAGLKILIGAAIGKTLDDSIEGRIHLPS